MYQLVLKYKDCFIIYISHEMFLTFTGMTVTLSQVHTLVHTLEITWKLRTYPPRLRGPTRDPSTFDLRAASPPVLPKASRRKWRESKGLAACQKESLPESEVGRWEARARRRRRGDSFAGTAAGTAFVAGGTYRTQTESRDSSKI